MDDLVNVRLPRSRWDMVCEMAKREFRSGTGQLVVVVDKGLGLPAAFDIFRLARERENKLMDGES